MLSIDGLVSPYSHLDITGLPGEDARQNLEEQTANNDKSENYWE
jgi:hypothetical protein